MSDERAFPNTGNPTWGMEPELGMTMRDWFAGHALTGWLSDGGPRPSDELVAREVYGIADAMLAERAKRMS